MDTDRFDSLRKLVAHFENRKARASERLSQSAGGRRGSVKDS